MQLARTDYLINKNFYFYLKIVYFQLEFLNHPYEKKYSMLMYFLFKQKLNMILYVLTK